MPAQDRVRPDQQSQTVQARPWQAVEQGGHPGAVGQVEPNPLTVQVTLQHPELVSENEDLCVLVAVAAW